jgi:hypothetical protein
MSYGGTSITSPVALYSSVMWQVSAPYTASVSFIRETTLCKKKPSVSCHFFKIKQHAVSSSLYGINLFYSVVRQYKKEKKFVCRWPTTALCCPSRPSASSRSHATAPACSCPASTHTLVAHPHGRKVNSPIPLRKNIL